jgi:hypothetical protein
MYRQVISREKREATDARNRSRGNRTPAAEPVEWRSHDTSILLIALALWATTWMLDGCGGGAGMETESSTSTPAPQLVASPTSVAFGNVAAGTSGTQTVTLTNPGEAAVIVSGAKASGASFSLGAVSLPFTLSAGQTASLAVHFSPTAAGNATGSVLVDSNAADSPLTVMLSGNGIAVTLSVSPSSLSFGNVVLSASSILPIVVTNIGSTGVTISQATTTGAGFSVSGPALPLTFAAGQNTTFSVTFAPSATGSVTGALSIASNATDSPNIEPLSATGVNPPSVSLTWVASASSNVAGYNVYRSAVSGGPYTELNSSLVTGTSYTDTTVEFGDTYYYAVTAANSQGVESADSNQAAVTVPSP